MFNRVSLVDITYRCAFCLLKESALKVVFFNMLCINLFRFFICFCLFNAYESQVKKSLIKCRIFLSLFYIFLQDKINDDHKEKTRQIQILCLGKILVYITVQTEFEAHMLSYLAFTAIVCLGIESMNISQRQAMFALSI